MSSKRIRTLAFATAIALCGGVGFSSVAEAHYRTCRPHGWHYGWHKGWHAHRGYAYRGYTRYGFARPATYGYGGYGLYGANVYGAAPGCVTPGYYGYAGDGGLFGMGFDGGGLLGLGLGPL
jgi:hypothetical protein